MDFYKLNLQRFAGEGGEAAPAAEPAGGGGAETAAAEQAAPGPINAGGTLADGTRVPNAQVAAALEKQMKRHPELRSVYGQAPQQQAMQAAPAEKTIDQRWEEAKKGEFAELYGRDVQRAIQDRFKNQKQTQDQLNQLEPMLKVLRDRAGVASNEELSKQILDDDSLYEDEANARGMTIPAYREFMAMKQKVQDAEQREAHAFEEQQRREHFNKLLQQAEQLKQTYPEFDLMQEINNPAFLRMTSKEVGISVEDAYFAIHHKDLGPQMITYGMQRARQQMGQTIQAQRQRPVEGAMKTSVQPKAEMRVDPRNLTPQERKEIKRQVMMGKRVSFD